MFADFGEHRGVSAGAGANDTVGLPGELAPLDESDEKTSWPWLLYTEVWRVKARHVCKWEKVHGWELQVLSHVELGEDPCLLGTRS